MTDPHTRSIREFRELAALAARSNITPPLPNLDNVDHISRMPDDILKSIISLLTMREAAATSLLSPRWRDLWTTSLSCLNFDLPNMRGYGYPSEFFEKKTQDYITTKRLKFTKWVNNVITHFISHDLSRLDALRVSFILNKDSAPDIDTWITSSVARGVTDIHLDFHYDKFYGALHDPFKAYVFHAHQVASTIRHLHLKFCRLHLPPDFTGFTSLVSLSLYGVYITPELLENCILPQSPLLEFLNLDGCFHRDKSSYKFSGTSLRLKHLHMGTTFDITSIEVHNINLLSFELLRDVPKLSIQNAPHLARLVLLNGRPIDIISNTPRLETLFLRQFEEETCDVPHPYLLNNLKRLVFVSLCGSKTNPLGVVNVLKDCDSLQKLEIDMGITDKSERRRTKESEKKRTEKVKKLTALPGFPFHNLKEIEIYGFENYPEEVALVEYLLNNAVVLQKIKINRTSKAYHGNGRWEPRK